MRSLWGPAVNNHRGLGRWAVLEITDIYEATKQFRAWLDAHRPDMASMTLAMARKTTTLDPALAERERVLRILHEAAPRLRARGITRLSLFGSMARGEAGPKSDIDLLIEVDPAARFGLSDLLDLQEELGDWLGRPINFAFASEMRPWLQEWIEEDRIGIL